MGADLHVQILIYIHLTRIVNQSDVTPGNPSGTSAMAYYTPSACPEKRDRVSHSVKAPSTSSGSTNQHTSVTPSLPSSMAATFTLSSVTYRYAQNAHGATHKSPKNGLPHRPRRNGRSNIRTIQVRDSSFMALQNTIYRASILIRNLRDVPAIQRS